MIIGMMETREIRIYASIDDALAEWGPFPTDLLSGVIIFYDQDGTYLEPIASYAPKKWFQLRPRIYSIQLRRETAISPFQDPLPYVLHYEAISLVPNPWVDSLERLRSMYPYNPVQCDSGSST